MRPKMKPHVGLCLVLILSCGPAPEKLPFEPAGPSAAPEPSKMGPFPVGVRTVEWTDTTRKNADGSPRKLITEVWYPAVLEAKSGEKVSYDVRTILTDEQRQKASQFDVPQIHTEAVRDAQVSPLGPFPVILFSHGQGGIRWQSTYFTVVAASHGYVVAAPDHEGNTLGDALRGQLTAPTEGVATRPEDLRFLLTLLSRLKEPDPLYGKLDIQKVGVVGHSFGALTALRLAAIDSRVDVIVPQTPVDAAVAWFALPKVELKIPVMIQGSKEDQTLPWDKHVVPTWDALSRPRYLFELSKGGHFSYSDLCALDLARVARELAIPEAADVEEVLNDGCGPTSPPASIALPLINHFAIALLNAELRGSEGSRAFLRQEEADKWGANVARFTADVGP